MKKKGYLLAKRGLPAIREEEEDEREDTDLEEGLCKC